MKLRMMSLVCVLLSVGPLTNASEGRRMRDADPGSAAGAYLCAEFAMSEGDYGLASDQFAVALAAAPDNFGVSVRAMDATLLAGRFAVPLAWTVARMEPGNAVAQAVLGDGSAEAGAWPAAAQHFAAMSGEGVFGLMKAPLLAWAQFGAGRPDAMRALMAPGPHGAAVGGGTLLQAGLMADLDNRPMDAERFYRTAQAELGPGNADLARALASLLARQGRQAEALSILAASGDMGLGLEASAARLRAAVADRPVRDAADAIGHVYLSFAMLALEHKSPDVAELLLRLALSLRPDMSLARLLEADLLAEEHRDRAALAVLAPIAASDVFAPSAEARRAAIGRRRRK